MRELPPNAPKSQETLEKELRVIMGQISDENLMQLQTFGSFLIHKYGEETCRNMRLFHILISSTPTPSYVNGDFPGMDSIESFIRSFSEDKTTP